MRTSACLIVMCGLVFGCGGSKPPQAAAVPAEENAAAADSESSAESSETAEPKGSAEIPTTCAKSDGICTPDASWVRRLCAESHPSVALVLFAKGTPWKRGYLTRKTEAWNAAGGASEAVQLAFDEEILVLVERGTPTGGMQVSGAGGGYEVLRWDGSCVTLSKEELSFSRPPAPKAAKVEWRWLDDSTQEALSNDPEVKTAYQTRRTECKGATMGTVSLKCEKADTKLSEVIVEYVRSGGDVGKPEKLP